MDNSSAVRWAYGLAAGGTLVSVGGFVPWVNSIGGVVRGRPSTIAALALIVFGAVPAILGQRVARHPAASVARTFMWVFASIDLVGWFVMCLGLVLASSIGLESFARPEAGFFLCFVGLMTIFVSTIFVHGRSANSAVTRLVLPPRQ